MDNEEARITAEELSEAADVEITPPQPVDTHYQISQPPPTKPPKIPWWRRLLGPIDV